MSEFPTSMLWFNVRDHHGITVTSLTPKSPWFSSLSIFKTRHFAANFSLLPSFWNLNFPLWHPSGIVILEHCFSDWVHLLGLAQPQVSRANSGHLFHFWDVPFLGTLFQKWKCMFQKWVSKFQTFVRSFQKWNENDLCHQNQFWAILVGAP